MGKRFASVNNFGFGGTNAHVVLEKAPFIKKQELELELEPTDFAVQSRKLFILSANDKGALEALMKNIGIYLEQRPEIFQNDLMSNIAYTLGQRRSLMQWRVAISAKLSFDLIQALNSGKITPVRETDPPRIGFIFTGQGKNGICSSSLMLTQKRSSMERDGSRAVRAISGIRFNHGCL